MVICNEWQFLMNDPHSPIIDFYPEDFQVDLKERSKFINFDKNYIFHRFSRKLGRKTQN